MVRFSRWNDVDDRGAWRLPGGVADHDLIQCEWIEYG
jgi:hypothetical protein